MYHPPPLPRPMPSARHVDDTRSPGWHSYTTLYMHRSPGGTRTPRSPPRRRCRPPSTALPASPPPPRCCARSTRTATGAPTSARSRRVLCPPSLCPLSRLDRGYLGAALWHAKHTPSPAGTSTARPQPTPRRTSPRPTGPRHGRALARRRGGRVEDSPATCPRHAAQARWFVDEDYFSRLTPSGGHTPSADERVAMEVELSGCSTDCTMRASPPPACRASGGAAARPRRRHARLPRRRRRRARVGRRARRGGAAVACGGAPRARRRGDARRRVGECGGGGGGGRCR